MDAAGVLPVEDDDRVEVVTKPGEYYYSPVHCTGGVLQQMQKYLSPDIAELRPG